MKLAFLYATPSYYIAFFERVELSQRKLSEYPLQIFGKKSETRKYVYDVARKIGGKESLKIIKLFPKSFKGMLHLSVF